MNDKKRLDIDFKLEAAKPLDLEADLEITYIANIKLFEYSEEQIIDQLSTYNSKTLSEITVREMLFWLIVNTFMS